MSRRIVRLPRPEDVARVAAERWRELATEAVRARGRFVVALAGGSTPAALYRLLAQPSPAEPLPWPSTDVLFGDERCVPPGHERSNFRMANETLLAHVPVPEEQVLRLPGEKEPEEGAALYERQLRELFPDGRAAFDLVLLGIGADGHTASLFPDTAALDESERWVAPNYAHRQAEWRLTLTYPALAGARHLLFLITGSAKAEVVAQAFGDLPHSTPYPCERVSLDEGTIEVLADEAAASRLPD